MNKCAQCASTVVAKNVLNKRLDNEHLGRKEPMRGKSHLPPPPFPSNTIPDSTYYIPPQ